MSTMHKLDGVYTAVHQGRAGRAAGPQRERSMTGDGARDDHRGGQADDLPDTNLQLSENGLRVLAFAIKRVSGRHRVPGRSPWKDENDCTFVGLISHDRPAARGIQEGGRRRQTRPASRTVMITGDHKVTATAIAKEIGIFQEGDIAVRRRRSSTRMNDEELDEKLEHISVYARVSPEHKIRIVDAWQKKGKIVCDDRRRRQRRACAQEGGHRRRHGHHRHRGFQGCGLA